MLVLFQSGSLFILLHCILGFPLHHQGIAQIIVGNGIGVVHLDGFLVLHLGIREHAVAQQAIAMTNMVTIGLC